MEKRKNIIAFSDNIEYIRTLPDNSIDAIVTDSPYGLGKEPDVIKMLQAWLDHGYLEVSGKGFMGKKWDCFVPQPVLWKECLRVLKPGGHLLSFFGTRTYDWGTMAIRLAGFEIRDCIQWLYGSGFPKSMAIDKAIVKEAGAVREITGYANYTTPDIRNNTFAGEETTNRERLSAAITAPATEAAKQWQGWGTALKPANEPICVARKPLEKGLTIAENIQKWGVGGINIDGCRVASEDKITNHSRGSESALSKGKYGDSKEQETHQTNGQQLGRFPANVILDEEAGFVLDQQTGTLISGSVSADGFKGEYSGSVFGKYANNSIDPTTVYADTGGASRFFYCAKASQTERMGRKHPTIKPLKLMAYLVRLVCPPGGIVLDPHFGSGTTGAACVEEDFYYIGIDNDESSIKEAKVYIEKIKKQSDDFLLY